MKNKITKSFKAMLIGDILKHLHWQGTHMRLPYSWNGESRYARIKLAALLKAIEWDVKK